MDATRRALISWQREVRSQLQIVSIRDSLAHHLGRCHQQEPGLTDPNFQAFVSYSHESDEQFAASLQASLSRFAKPWYRLRTMRIFRDKTSLSANPALWQSIEDALGRSKYFLLLASPASAKSDWVRREVEWWLQNSSAE